MEITVELTPVECAECGTVFAISSVLYRTKRDDHSSFTCPNGHSLSYPAKSQAEKLAEQLAAVRDERDELASRVYEIERKEQKRREKISATRKLRAVS